MGASCNLFDVSTDVYLGICRAHSLNAVSRGKTVILYEKMPCVTAHSGSHTMMAKPKKTLQLNYPVIQFLTIVVTDDISGLISYMQTIRVNILVFYDSVFDRKMRFTF